ncbi:MAG TPA: sulfate ABC transporter permease subunit CysT [Gemmatimonadota bacterium]|jgi:sulfate transport system permease protein|nr:sulfate ABC transporter permease subunit CysT [Gemmatimonadota bacterium]
MSARLDSSAGGATLPLPRQSTARAPQPWGRWGLRATACLYLGLMIVLPLAAIAQHGLADGLSAFLDDVTQPLAVEALALTIGAAVIMTAVNAVMGTLTAYALVRYRFPGRAVLDAIVDLPFAIPTLVTGVMLVALYGPQTGVGSWLTAHGLPVIYAKPGIVLALLFVCYPFVIRTVQPVLHGAEKSQEEAAWTLGASGWTTFRRVVLPTIGPAILTGSMLSFARALGEFGSIIVVAGNIPGSTLTAPVYLYQQVEGDNTGAASAISIVLLVLSFTTMWAIERLQRRGEGPRARV